MTPLLTTARLELWQPQLGDLADLFDLTFAEETRAFLGSFVPSEMDSFNRLHRNAGSWALHGYGAFMVRRTGSAKIIGNCGVFRSHRGFGVEFGLDDVPEAGWILHKDAQGAGIAREAMEAALAWFDGAHGPQRIACMIEDGHAASERLAAKLGFAEYARHQVEGDKPLVLYERT
ncbi:GNAT family protein [Novosphingobium sp.]|uniref:GNAT family N-acetyltransferase n=1 Tax=Novosphingobium sp. TaxID=1874826 RepID=UPI002869FA9E|nr:GNAT family protein [Novosphingobium sp.]